MIRAIALTLLGAASFGAVYWAMGPAEPETASAPALNDIASPETTAAIDAAAAPRDAVAFELRPGTAAPAQNAQAAIRNVTPANMTAAPAPTAPLVRTAQTSPKTAQPSAEPQTKRLFNPIVVSAGSFKIGERELHLAGVTATDPEKSCGEGSAAWPCGRVARSALRSFIRGRAIECEIPTGAKEIPDPARCKVAEDDIGAWLVAQGWAEADGDYADAAKAASDAKLGLFGAGRPDAQAEEVATRR